MLKKIAQRFVETAHLMVGVPDYENYCQHMRKCHPDRQPLSQAQFVALAQEMRYGGKRSGKCPC